MSVKKLTKVVKLLEKEGNTSPNRIATKVGSDRRTIKTMLKEATDLGMVQCRTLDVGGRKYSACSLTPEYQKILKNKAKN